MTVTAYRYSAVIHPLHAILLAGSVPLFLGAAFCDIAYAATFQIQWSDFASWLIVGGLLWTAAALLFVIVDVFRAARRAGGFGWYAIALLATWIVGLFNALVHARDAWAMMPAGLVLSVIGAALAIVATWFGFRARGADRPSVHAPTPSAFAARRPQAATIGGAQ